ncbi:esterase/lipase family protein [Pseudomonas putida]
MDKKIKSMISSLAQLKIEVDLLQASGDTNPLSNVQKQQYQRRYRELSELIEGLPEKLRAEVERLQQKAAKAAAVEKKHRAAIGSIPGGFMSRHIVIVHGWSDDGKAFKKLASEIAKWSQEPPVQINIADWISLHNNVTYADIAVAMKRAWEKLKLPTESRSVDVVTHSTGALVVREWMTRFYKHDTVPILHFLMLAPANFGSPLAHKGRSFIGRAYKGWGNFTTPTGTQILKGLELGSPYTVELAKKDLFSQEAWYGAGRILATVLVGNVGYDGVRAIANEDGGDGTVRISTANLNCALLQLTLDSNQQVYKEGWRLIESRGDIAFGIMDQENHSTIALKDGGPYNPNTLGLIKRALMVSDQDFPGSNNTFSWQDEIHAADPFVEGRSPRYLNLVTHASDNVGHDISDYFIELYRKINTDKAFEKEIYEDVFKTVHAYEDNEAYRSLYISIKDLTNIVGRYTVDTLYLSLSAEPVFEPPRMPVGYRSINAATADGLPIAKDEIKNYFKAHRTLITEVVLERQIDDAVFKLK